MPYDNFAKAYLKMLRESTEYLSEDILMEDRIEYLKQNTKPINTSHDTFAIHRNNNDIIDFLANNADPSKKKIYTQHLIKMYHGGAFRQEDAQRVKDAINNFDKYKSKLTPEQRDIKKYSKISDIEATVTPHLGTGATKAEEKDILKDNPHIPGKHELKYDDENISIYHIKDKETSKKLYAQPTANKPGVFPTEWCTAFAPPREHNAFDQHNEKGNLFVVHRKSDGEVFQYHPATNQFMNSKDNEINVNDLNTIKSSLHKAWSHNHALLGYTDKDAMLPLDHQLFLGKYSSPEHHFDMNIAPVVYLSKQHTDDNMVTQIINKVINQHDKKIKNHVFNSPRLTSEHINHVLIHGTPYDKLAIHSNPNFMDEHISTGLNDPNPAVRAEAISSYRAKSEHTAKAMKDPDHNVRIAAVLYSKRKSDVLAAKRDPHPDVRAAYAEVYPDENNNGY